MARRRKTEMKSSVKSSLKYVPVRKSSRQIAKKQLEERKVNGDVLQTPYANESEDSGSVAENQSQTLPPKRSQNSSRKHSKHKNIADSGVLLTNKECSYTTSQYKKDASESDSQDAPDVAVDPSDKLSLEDVKQVVVGDSNKEVTIEPDSTEIEAWPVDVVEETIVCEEMEVKEDVKDAVYCANQGDNAPKEVPITNNSPLEATNFVEYTVIQNKSGTVSMLEEPDSGNNTPTDDCYYDTQRDTRDSLKTENSVTALCIDVPMTSNDSNEKSFSLEKPYTRSTNAANDQEDSCVAKDTRTRSLEETLSGEDADTFCKIDNKMAGIPIREPSKEIQKLVNDLSRMENVMSPLQIAGTTEKVIPMSVDDESSSSILDKMEQLHRSNNSAPLPDDPEKSAAESSKSDFCEEKAQCPSQPLQKSKFLPDRKNGHQRKTTGLQATEELYCDSEADNKIDGEDTKLSSSSENSNDTMLSVTNCKLPEFDAKCSNNSNDIDKKVEFRSRSGSTDTTGSESGSNSSGVRRSSRIRSIGLMKQRSRGRGLVTKPNIDITKSSVQQEREKVANNIISIAQEVKLDNQQEAQSDKENNVSKTANTFDSLTSLATTCNTAGYDSDSSKPVKVKSRWRRSSELEMGGSNTGSVSTVGSVFGSVTANISEFGSSVSLKYAIGAATDVCSSDSSSGSALPATHSQTCTDTEQTKESSTSGNCNNLVQIPKTVGAKISLPMVPEIKDREMEERLSQFENLQENMYLTERYTNKETKRMVCDCFLTDEEIERGELGCGEDCLNRLLMIECGPRCVVGDRCTNKRFQNCEYAKCEVFRTEKKGFGLRAIIDLLAGEFIMEYVGEVVDPKDFRRRAKEYSKDKNKHYYFMALKSDQIIDATMKGNVSRFINHSCDPNSETQKWTVNGELRIGFFNKRFIAAGDEITFDYHFQRYGKEAQKCFCEAANCRGWIGETPEEEKEKIEKKEKREKDMKKKKGEKKQADYMEDEDLEEEIDKLCSGGLKNRAHTLTLSRLMVRSRELEHRTRLLRLIQSGEQPCRRLFLDYHGLRLIWSYVMDISTNDSDEAQQFRLEVLKTLNTLPIPNKTMLMDSKIYNVVEKWSRRLYFSLSGDSPEDDQAKSKSNGDELQLGYENNEKEENSLDGDEIKSENADQNVIPELASSLLVEWSNLKEVFRIPKKERIEQMKEHEREADRGYREELEKEEKRGTSYDRHRSDRYGRTETEKQRRRGRESPESEHARTKDKRIEERSSLVPIPRMTKYERRQLFAMKVAKEEEERQRRQQQESWQDHENRCLALGIDPHTTAMVDPQTGYPVFYNPSIGQWQQYPTQDGEMSQQCTPVYVGGPQATAGHAQSAMVAQTAHVLPPTMSSEISPGMAGSIPSGVPPVVYSLGQAPAFNQTTTAYPLMPHCHQQYPDGQLPLSNNLVASANAVTLPAQPIYEHIEKQSDQQYPATFRQPHQAELPAIDLPPKWKTATDERGRTYYYHVKERISQWLPPPPDHIGVQPDSSSTSESSEESSSSNEEEEEIEEDNEEAKGEELNVNNTLTEKSMNETKQQSAAKKSVVLNVSGSGGTFPEGKKRREGLVQERIISPRREEDRMDHKTHKGIKEKLRRQKERAKFKEHVDKIRRHRRSNKSKSHSRHSLNKLQLQSADVSTMSERKIKDTFRINMANVMVHFLNPYRKNDCKQGRITNTEDFKHLARKLTHFVLAKELKHCKSVDELQCNENVKHKAKDFVRKYMSKFGAVYQKSTDED